MALFDLSSDFARHEKTPLEEGGVQNISVFYGFSKFANAVRAERNKNSLRQNAKRCRRWEFRQSNRNESGRKPTKPDSWEAAERGTQELGEMIRDLGTQDSGNRIAGVAPANSHPCIALA